MEILTPDKRLLRKKLRLWRECHAIDVTQRNGCWEFLPYQLIKKASVVARRALPLSLSVSVWRYNVDRGRPWTTTIVNHHKNVLVMINSERKLRVDLQQGLFRLLPRPPRQTNVSVFPQEGVASQPAIDSGWPSIMNQQRAASRILCLALLATIASPAPHNLLR